MNAAQIAALEVLKAGGTLTISNKNDLANGKIHHATAKYLLQNVYNVRVDGKVLSMWFETPAAPEPREETPVPTVNKDKVEAIRFARERMETCYRMWKNGTCTEGRYLSWKRKVEALERELHG